MENPYMNSLEYIDRSVSRLINEYNDEIEMEIIKYQDHYKVVVTICQEERPYKDFIASGTDKRSARRAARRALKGLYLEAYSVEKNH
jgi:shikimate kinase